MIINKEDWDWHQKVYSTLLHTTFHLSADYWGGGGGISRTGGVKQTQRGSSRKGMGQHMGGGNHFLCNGLEHYVPYRCL
jgi:hypothetical protein